MQADQNSKGSCLIGIDWGTSSFRLMEIDRSGRSVMTTSNHRGLGQIENEEAIEILQGAFSAHEAEPFLMCGMIGSTLGLQEVDYIDTPVNPITLASHLSVLRNSRLLKSSAYIVPGVRSKAGDSIDVMRGEEVQVCGWLGHHTGLEGLHLLCLPGTHSKWVTVEAGNIVQIETALTGELYSLLTEHSVLVNGEQMDSEEAFIRGVRRGSDNPDLLRQLFSVRAEVVAGDEDPRHASSYLSGLLIGSELTSMKTPDQNLQFISNSTLNQRYALAANQLEIECDCWDGVELAAHGLRLIWDLYEK